MPQAQSFLLLDLIMSYLNQWFSVYHVVQVQNDITWITSNHTKEETNGTNHQKATQKYTTIYSEKRHKKSYKENMILIWVAAC